MISLKLSNPCHSRWFPPPSDPPSAVIPDGTGFSPPPPPLPAPVLLPKIFSLASRFFDSWDFFRAVNLPTASLAP